MIKEILFHQSTLTTFQRCPYEFYLGTFLNLTLGEKKEKTSLSIGTAFHAGAECILKEQPLETAIQKALTVLEQEQGIDVKKKVCQCLLSLFDYFSKNGFPNVICTEKEMENGSIAGRLDAVIIENGRPVVMEFKTTSKNVDSSYFESHQLSNQPYLYMELAHTDTMRYYVVNTKNFGVYTQVFVYSPEIRRNWADDLKEAQDRLYAYQANSYWPQHKGNHCNSCEFKQICLTPSSEHGRIIKLQYKEKTNV
jgi:CRISPR/Cas system-associated exonuclease Cas4 (RecB family)